MIAISTYSGECDGLGLAAEMAGIEVAAYCEADPKRRTKLAEKHPGKPIFESDEELTADAARELGINADFLFGGPPCQPFSVAGLGRAESDPRHRWPEMLRFIQEYQPRWVLVENVSGFVNLALDLVLTDLENEGYEIGAIVFPALAIGAPHRRDRCFVVAHSDRRNDAAEEKVCAGGNPIVTCGGVAYSKGVGRTARGRTFRCRQRQSYADNASTPRGAKNGLADADGNVRRAHNARCGRMERTNRISQRKENADRPGNSGRGEHGTEGQKASGKGRTWRRKNRSIDGGILEYAGCTGCEEQHASAITNHQGHIAWRFAETGFIRATESRLGGVLDGVSHRLDAVKWPAWRGQEQYDWEPPRVGTNIPERPRRIESLGLAVVPWQAYPLMVLIKEMDEILEGR